MECQRLMVCVLHDCHLHKGCRFHLALPFNPRRPYETSTGLHSRHYRWRAHHIYRVSVHGPALDRWDATERNGR